MTGATNWWIEVPVALLLVVSGLFTLTASVGLVRFRTFFQRMHPPALAFSFSAWCVTAASILYFSSLEQTLSLHAWLIIIFLSLTVPVTTILLARTELFRKRLSDHRAGDVPPPLSFGNGASAAPGGDPRGDAGPVGAAGEHEGRSGPARAGDQPAT